MDGELVRLYQLLNELCESVSANQKVASSLVEQTNSVKAQATHSQTGFTLRRYNVDLTEEVFESELERQSAQIIIENQSFLQENKQLGLLLKEYEETMSTIMDKFHNHALAAQQHEQTLIRHYETLLSSQDSQDPSADLAVAHNLARSMRRLSIHLRNLLQSMAGEEPSDDGEAHDIPSLLALLDSLDEKSDQEDWAIERQHEIQRLERENAELRKMLGIDPTSIADTGMDMDAEIARMEAPRNPMLAERAHAQRQSSGNGSSPQGGWDSRPYWHDTNGFQPQSNQQQIMQVQQQQPNLPRMAAPRRTGIFGANQQRGAFNMGGIKHLQH